jgi:subtilisin-like proprotein convertase family protein
MKKSTFFFLSFLFAASISFSQNITDEYGSLNSNRYLSGLGIAASYVNVPYHSQFELIVKGTIEMWIYPTSYSGSAKTLISKGSTANVSFLWGLSASTGIMYFRIGSTDFVNTGGTAPPLNQWSHVAVTWSGGPNFTVKFYLNGAQTGTSVANSAAWYLSTDVVRIGGSQGYPGNAFLGYIDEVRIWSSENSASKIVESRFVGIGDGTNANSSGQLTTNSYYSGLISSWTFNTTGTTAADNISGFNGTYIGSATSTAQTISTPLPYNFALKFGGGSSDYVSVPHSSNFNQTSDGTFELWYYPISFSTEQILVSKGASPTTISFILGVAASTGKLYFGSGTSIALNTSGAGLTLNTWNHIAVTWATVGSNFEVNFYKNGSLNGSPSTIVRTFPTNSNSVYIGNSQVYNLPAKGFIDELRLWNPALTQEQIRNYMFVSCRAISNSNLLAAWNFDGNLNSFAATSGITGSFNTGSSNGCRFSGYLNDGAPGVFNSSFISHTTVINRTGSPNPFPTGFFIKNPFMTIPDNNPAGVSDSFLVTGLPGNLNSIEVFISVQHTYVNDLTISLKAPNGQSRNLVANNGGSADNILSFFSDNFTYLPSSTEYIPPWGFAKPISPFNQFNGTLLEGTWTIKCVDNASADVGVLRGWGIRFNNLVSVEPISGNVPVRYYLYQNFPNPFNPVTNIKFDIPKDEYVTIKLFDILGREVRTLADEFKKAGSYDVRIDGSNISSGTYFYRINAGNFVDTKKMVLVK